MSVSEYDMNVNRGHTFWIWDVSGPSIGMNVVFPKTPHKLSLSSRPDIWGENDFVIVDGSYSSISHDSRSSLAFDNGFICNVRNATHLQEVENFIK